MRTLLVGLDGADVSILERLFESATVPTLESICRRGIVDDLTSQVPPWTPSAWPSLYTGVNPGKHGVFGFLRFEGYDWRVVDRTDVREFALWELLGEYGHRSVVVNVPVTHPPRDVDGALVPGYVGPEDPACVPEDALSLLDDDYRIYPPRDVDGSRSARIEAYESLVRSRGRVFRTLTERVEPAFGFLQFQQTDTVFHDLPDDWDAVERVYEAVDDELGAVLDAVDPRNVIVVSDHGMGEYTGYEFRANEFLRDRGYVETVRGGEGMPSWDSIARNQLEQGEADGERERGLLERGVAMTARVGLTSQRIERALETIGVADRVASVVPTDAIRAGTEQVDFAASQAYLRSRIELGVRLNVEGREPDGVVPQERYEAVRQSLIEQLRSVQTPDGDPVFEAVCPREVVFEGPYVDRAPDVIVVPDDFDHFLTGALHGSLFATPREPWNHKRAGVIAARGADIDPDGAAADRTPHLFDVAPTVLATLDVPPSERMDGRVLPIVDPIDPKQYPEFDARETRSTTRPEVEQHLAQLGYLEDV
jgi:predicted AlkP superfamily phosphohydrolase/phosphomutase